MLVSVGLAAVGDPLFQPSTVEPWNGHYSQLWEAGGRRSSEYETQTVGAVGLYMGWNLGSNQRWQDVPIGWWT